VSGGGQVYIATLMDRLGHDGDRPVLTHDGRETTAAGLRAAVHRHAVALARHGIGRGSLVALLAPNTPDALAVRYAAHLIGAAACYLPMLPPDRCAALVEEIDPQLLVVFPETAAVLPAHVTAPVAAVGADLSGTTLRLDEPAGSAGDATCLARPDDLGVVAASGGTTAAPKCSVRTFEAYTAMVLAVPRATGRRQLVNGKLAYLSQVLVDATLVGGGSVVLRATFDAADTLATVEAERITHLFLVEPQLAELIAHADVGHRDLSSLRALTHVGSAAPPTLRRRARDRLGPTLAHTYGASEIGLVSALMPDGYDQDRFTSAGRVLPGVEVRLRRADGRVAAPREAGTIEVRSPAMAHGYRNRPAEQAATFVDGWFRTGDIGAFDDDGRLRIVGRAAETLRLDGRLVAPPAVQDTLCHVPGVEFAVVVPDVGGWVGAVVATDGAAVDAAACRAAVVAEHGAGVAARLTVVPLDRVPLTEQGKPDGPRIRALTREAEPTS
jgi:fatty-acyl-CoA synthase